MHQLEDVLFGSMEVADSLTIMAVKLSSENGQRLLGVAFNEPSSEQLGVAQFIENDQFSNLEVSVAISMFCDRNAVLDYLQIGNDK